MQRVSCLFVRLSFCYNLDNKQFMKFYLTYRMAGKQTKNIVNQKRVKLQIMSQGRVATCLKCVIIYIILFYYRFTAESMKKIEKKQSVFDEVIGKRIVTS